MIRRLLRLFRRRRYAPPGLPALGPYVRGVSVATHVIEATYRGRLG